MSIIEEGKQDVIESAIKFVSQNEKMQPKKHGKFYPIMEILWMQ